MKNNLKLLRRQRGYTQLAVQMKTGIEQALLSKYENGGRVPPTETLVQLADFYSVSLDWTKQSGVQRFFRLNSVLIGFVALRSAYASMLRSGCRAAKKRCLPKIFDLKREDFPVLEVEERSNTAVLQVMRQTKRRNTPFQELLYPDCFVYLLCRTDDPQVHRLP